MYSTRSSYKSISAESLTFRFNSNSNSVPESANGASGLKSRVSSLRKKMVKQEDLAPAKRKINGHNVTLLRFSYIVELGFSKLSKYYDNSLKVKSFVANSLIPLSCKQK
ncbi:hypothetical protein Bca101_059747 [Brassica carinata]